MVGISTKGNDPGEESQRYDHPSRNLNIEELLVRHYLPQDLEQCRGLWAELTQWQGEIYQDLGIGGKDPGKYFDGHLSHVGAENIWVAVSEGLIAGMAGLIRGKSSAEIEPVVVNSSFRGRGVARRLIETIAKLAREKGIYELTVRPVARNEAAIAFFHTMGSATQATLN